jgi:hypothetical protein
MHGTLNQGWIGEIARSLPHQMAKTPREKRSQIRTGITARAGTGDASLG